MNAAFLARLRKYCDQGVLVLLLHRAAPTLPTGRQLAHPDQLHLPRLISRKALHAGPTFVEGVVKVINDGDPVVVVKQIQDSMAACAQAKSDGKHSRQVSAGHDT